MYCMFNWGIGVVMLFILFVLLLVLVWENLFVEDEFVVFEVLVVIGEKCECLLKDMVFLVLFISVCDIDCKQIGNVLVVEVINGSFNVVYIDLVGVLIICGQDIQGLNNGQNVFWGGIVLWVMINFDGYYLNYNEMFFGVILVWDVDSIEVFCGLQIIFQGVNVIVGVIIVNIKDLIFSFEVVYQVEIGSYYLWCSLIVVFGLLVQDFVGCLVVDYVGCDIFIDYDNLKFQDSGIDQDFCVFNVCVKLFWLFSGILGLESKFIFFYNDSNCLIQEVVICLFDKFDYCLIIMFSWEQDINISIFDVVYDFDNGICLFNQVQYLLFLVYCIIGVGGEGDVDICQKNVFNELWISFGEQEDWISGMGGVYYVCICIDEILYLCGLLVFDDMKKNFGVFGELNYCLSDCWILIIGLCYQEDCIECSGNLVLVLCLLDYQKIFLVFLLKVFLVFVVILDWIVGGLVSCGYNFGGVLFNLIICNWVYFKEEIIWNYELFICVSLFDGCLLLNGNLFFMDFKDVQYNILVVVLLGVVQLYIINVEKVYVYGMELDFDYCLCDDLWLKVSVGVLCIWIDEMFGNIGYEYNEFVCLLGYIFSFGLSWDVIECFNLNVQVCYLDGYYLDIVNIKVYLIKVYIFIDVCVSYCFNDQVQFYGYVKNVFDDCLFIYMQENWGIGGIEVSMMQLWIFGIGIKGIFQVF